MNSAPVIIHIDGLLTAEEAERAHERFAALLARALSAEPPRWVLVKGYHDSGTIDDVFGPYSEEYANWLLRKMLDCSPNNWTMVRLSSGPEDT